MGYQSGKSRNVSKSKLFKGKEECIKSINRPSLHIHHYYVIYYLYRKDARLPVQLQRAMAAEAEAAREARAKVCCYILLLKVVK